MLNCVSYRFIVSNTELGMAIFVLLFSPGNHSTRDGGLSLHVARVPITDRIVLQINK